MGNKYSDDYSNAANQLGLAGVGRSATFGGLTGAGKVQQGPPPTVLENLKRQREIEAQSLSHHSKLAYRHGLNVADLDTAIAALEPAPEYDPSSLAHEEELAPALADPLSAELRSVTPATEEESGDQIEIPEGFTRWAGGECPAADSDTIDVLYRNGIHEIFTPGMITDEDTWHHNDDELDIIAYRIISQPADQSDATAKAVLDAMVDKAFGDLSLSDDTAAVQTYMEGDELVVREISADEYFAPADKSDPSSIVDDPELQAAVSRAEATLAAAEPAYVGLQDAQLDADWDAMKERQEAGRKLHFSIFGKREEV